MSNFNKHKIYRVVEKTDVEGNQSFEVQAANSWFAAFMGDWHEYEKQNYSLDEAIDQIGHLAKCRQKSHKIVYKTRV